MKARRNHPCSPHVTSDGPESWARLAKPKSAAARRHTNQPPKAATRRRRGGYEQTTPNKRGTREVTRANRSPPPNRQLCHAQGRQQPHRPRLSRYEPHAWRSPATPRAPVPTSSGATSTAWPAVGARGSSKSTTSASKLEIPRRDRKAGLIQPKSKAPSSSEADRRGACTMQGPIFQRFTVLIGRRHRRKCRSLCRTGGSLFNNASPRHRLPLLRHPPKVAGDEPTSPARDPGSRSRACGGEASTAFQWTRSPRCGVLALSKPPRRRRDWSRRWRGRRSPRAPRRRRDLSQIEGSGRRRPVPGSAYGGIQFDVVEGPCTNNVLDGLPR